jgi:hypothetical protein
MSVCVSVPVCVRMHLTSYHHFQLMAEIKMFALNSVLSQFCFHDTVCNGALLCAYQCDSDTRTKTLPPPSMAPAAAPARAMSPPSIPRAPRQSQRGWARCCAHCHRPHVACSAHACPCPHRVATCAIATFSLIKVQSRILSCFAISSYAFEHHFDRASVIAHSLVFFPPPRRSVPLFGRQWAARDPSGRSALAALAAAARVAGARVDRRALHSRRRLDSHCARAGGQLRPRARRRACHLSATRSACALHGRDRVRGTALTHIPHFVADV